MESKNIARLIQTIAKKGISINDAVIGTVITGSVDTDKGLCDVQPINDDAKIVGVKLRTQQSKSTGSVTDFMLMAPVEESQVIVNFTSAGQGFVSMYSEIESVKFVLNNESITFDLTGSEIKLNGDNNDGIVRVTDLVTKLNNLENDINNLKSLFGSWTPVPNDGGAALKAVLSGYISSTLTTTTQTDLENTTVKHGE